MKWLERVRIKTLENGEIKIMESNNNQALVIAFQNLINDIVTPKIAELKKSIDESVRNNKIDIDKLNSSIKSLESLFGKDNEALIGVLSSLRLLSKSVDNIKIEEKK